MSESAEESADCRESISRVSNVVKDGDWAIIKMNDDQDSILHITKHQQQKIGRTKISVTPLVGESYGSIFDINGKVITKLAGELLDAHNVQVPSSYVPDGDNSLFSDTNTAQKLTPEAIEQLRAEGATGNDIITSLIANSESWNNKTEFSQEKWLRRKQKKYTQRIRLLKCTPVNICDAYYKKNPSKMLSDNLATILSYGGIYSGGRPLIFDDMIGLVVGSAAYQMRGQGQIFGVYFGQQPHFELVDRLNLSTRDHSIIRQIADASHYATQRGLLTTPSEIAAFKAHDRVIITEKYRQDAEARGAWKKNGGWVKAQEEKQEKEKKGGLNSRPHQSSGRQLEDLLEIRSSLREGFHSLIIATGFHPLPLLKQSLPLLRPSSPLVIYCEFRQPLVECYVHLQHRGLAVKLQLVDPWMREFQVLAERCHPEMTVNMTAGCILTGVVVCSKTEQEAAAAAAAAIAAASSASVSDNKSSTTEELVQPSPIAKRQKVADYEK